SQIVVEPYTLTGPGSTQPPGTTTYRVYAEMMQASDKLVAVFATAGCHSLHVSTSPSFHNDAFGTHLGAEVNYGFFQFFPMYEADSWVTINATSNVVQGAADVGAVSTIPASPYLPAVGTASNGVNLVMDDGAWYTLPNSPTALPVGPNNRVLLGQFTTSGVLYFALNIQVFIGGDQFNGRVDYVWNNDCIGQPNSTGFEAYFPGLWYSRCNDVNSCNYNPNATTNIDCFYTCGCNDPTACNFDPDDLVDYDCVYNTGCMDPIACDYNPMACYEGACDYGCGCNDPLGCNYDPSDLGTDDCLYTAGCMDTMACDYNPMACYEGSCYYGCGCNDPLGCNYDPSDLGSDDCEYITGCMDPSFCSFNPEACIEGSCEGVLGCMNEGAVNYDPNATCELGGCIYSVSGIVFHDANSNGFQDEGEAGLSLQTVNVSPGNYQSLTDDNGHFTLNLPPGSYSIGSSYISTFPITTTAMPIAYNTAAGSAEITIGKNFTTEISGICIDLYPNWAGLVCDQNNNFNICYRNMGNTPIDGYIAITKDELIPSFNEVTAIDSIVGNTAYLSFQNLNPNQMFFYDIGLQGTSFELMGEYVVNVADAYGFNNEGVQIAYGQRIRESQVLCAYDPNDKQVFPNGWEEPHYIEPDTTLEYLIRFQNTGNFQAFNITVRDTISEHLDLSTFELVANSHSVQTFIDPNTREIQFYFENIMLPDSNCCEPESHGLISYKIRPLPELAHDTRIENTAYIYFDSNPAVVTNTTWNSIYICDESLAAIEMSATEICEGQEIVFQNTSEFVETYEWMMDDQPIGSEEMLSLIGQESGVHSVSLRTENPFCDVTQTVEFEVIAAPLIEVSGTNEICPGEEATLLASGADTYTWNTGAEGESIIVAPNQTTTYSVTGVNSSSDCTGDANFVVTILELPVVGFAADANTLTSTAGASYQWFNNGILIEGATEQTLEITEDGIYSVEVTGDNGCVAMSDEVFVAYVGINEQWKENLSVYPIPVSKNDVLNIAGVNLAAINYIRIIDSTGKLVFESETGMRQIPIGDWASGTYTLHIDVQNEKITKKFVVK
ncbi:MAG: hypothetical protein RL226_1431, partial [Bacteroidota bacterium]